MSERDSRERDILVASNEYAYVQDLTKGDIVLYVGPTKISLSNTERLVDYRDGRFVALRGDDGVGVSAFVTASSSQYIVLENPPKDPGVRPIKGNNSASELRIGRRVVVPGPASFPLWPGQRARVIDGHALREDEYLIVRVYDVADDDARPIGAEAIVRGADVSFYVPRTGLEVLPGKQGGYVRKAYRLRQGKGLHLRVVKAFVAGEGDQVPAGPYDAGQDLFLADKEGFFFPTESLEIVGEISAIPLAEREGVYARELATGRIQTIVGPLNYLPDPTRMEIVHRELTDEVAELYGIADAQPGYAQSIYVPSGILAFDEDREVLELSTGKPKTSERTLRTCFLQTDGNKVSDVLRLKTADHNEIEVAVSYRVSFVTKNGEAERWFNVKDYVGLLCDHAGSLLRAAVRAATIQVFYQQSTEILRAAVLGEKRGDEPRTGRLFEENGMWIYDVEVLDVRILDPEVKMLIGDAQRNAMMADVHRRQEMLRLESERLKEEVNQSIYTSQIATLGKAVEHEETKRGLTLAQVESQLGVEDAQKLRRARAEAEALSIGSEARLSAVAKENELDRAQLQARVAAFKEQMGAMHPELVATLKMLGHQKLAGELSKNVSPLAILGGESVTDVVERLLGSLPLGADATVEKVLPAKAKRA